MKSTISQRVWVYSVIQCHTIKDEGERIPSLSLSQLLPQKLCLYLVHLLEPSELPFAQHILHHFVLAGELVLQTSHPLLLHPVTPLPLLLSHPHQLPSPLGGPGRRAMHRLRLFAFTLMPLRWTAQTIFRFQIFPLRFHVSGLRRPCSTVFLALLAEGGALDHFGAGSVLGIGGSLILEVEPSGERVLAFGVGAQGGLGGENVEFFRFATELQSGCGCLRSHRYQSLNQIYDMIMTLHRLFVNKLDLTICSSPLLGLRHSHWGQLLERQSQLAINNFNNILMSQEQVTGKTIDESTILAQQSSTGGPPTFEEQFTLNPTLPAQLTARPSLAMSMALKYPPKIRAQVVEMIKYYEEALASQLQQFHRAVKQQHKVKVRSNKIEANALVDQMREHTPIMQSVPVPVRSEQSQEKELAARVEELEETVLQKNEQIMQLNREVSDLVIKVRRYKKKVAE